MLRILKRMAIGVFAGFVLLEHKGKIAIKNPSDKIIRGIFLLTKILSSYCTTILDCITASPF